LLTVLTPPGRIGVYGVPLVPIAINIEAAKHRYRWAGFAELYQNNLGIKWIQYALESPFE
jgi:hypothetical protein